jgi:hypothetical protein
MGCPLPPEDMSRFKLEEERRVRKRAGKVSTKAPLEA